MKKHFLLFASLLLTVTVMAQKKQPISLNINAGITVADVKGNTVESLNNILNLTDGILTTSGRTGFYAGADVNIPIGKNFAITPGVAYAQKGMQLTGDLNIKGVNLAGLHANAKLNNDYIDIPLKLKANVGGLQFFAGPQFSYLLNSKLQTNAGALGIDLFSKTFDVSDQFARWDAGLTGGIGYTFNNGLSITAQYDHGLTPLDDGSRTKAYNRAFKVGVGIQF